MFIKSGSGIGSHPKLHTYEEGYLLPVLSGDQLLFGQRHKGLIRQIRDLSELSQEDFDLSYGQLIQNYMEFVQVLPHKTSGILGSLLNYGLARAAITYQKFCQLGKPQATPLLKLAVFSAALLKDVARVMTNQRITLVDDEGEFFRDWNPFTGSMVGQANYYKMYPITAAFFRFSAEITPMLAKQLIPRDLFLWLSDDLLVFSDWLSALLDQENDDSKIISWSLALIKREDIITVLNTLDGALVDMLGPTNEQGEAFLKWLKDAIANGKILVNGEDSGVTIVPEGVLLEAKLFKQFVDICKIPVDYSVVQFIVGNLMGIPSKGGNDYFHAKYSGAGDAATSFTTFSGGLAHKGKAPREGMVVDPQILLLSRETAASVSTLKSAKVMVAHNQQKPLNHYNVTQKINLTQK
ncbi:MAG: TraI domain-containing protein [Gammaproteobacteria bacterium]|nr:TraI domain-containing protein [Gammaproteobacteria bacterium]